MNNNYHDVNNIAIDGGNLDCNINYFTYSNEIRQNYNSDDCNRKNRIYDTRI